MSATYLSWNQGQTFLLPPSPDDWLPKDHLARFVLEVVERLDLSAIYVDIESDRAPQGRSNYPPRLMVALLLYAYMTGTMSSRQIERKTHEDIGYRFLCGNLHPSYRTIAEFRRRHLGHLAGLFEQTVRLCMDAGLVELELVAIDGTKILANASKRKAMSYGRMKKEKERLKDRISKLLEEAEQIDAAEDKEYGERDAMLRVRAELKSAKARREFIDKQMRALEEEARKARAHALREQAQALEERARQVEEDEPVEAKRKRTNAKKRRAKADDLDDDPPPPPAGTDVPAAKPPVTPDGEPKSRAQRNFTDPDSKVMMHDGSFVQAYNAQAAVDDARQIIVAQAVGNTAPDTHYFKPMVRRTSEVVGREPQECVADAGYWSEENVSVEDHPDIDVFIAVARMPHGPAPPASQSGEDKPGPRQAMKTKTESEDGRRRLIKRRVTAEPPFGHIKEQRRFRRFSMRGLEKARGEWAFVTAVHNLVKLFTHGPFLRAARI